MSVNILYVILIVAGILVGAALVWLLIELVLTIRKTRKKVDEIHEQITPTINNIESITSKIQPTIEKVDPLVERISLTVDAANLELMRADQILENVNVITEGVAGATTAVENIASAPAELVNKGIEKITNFVGGAEQQPNEILEPGVAGNFEDAEFADEVQRIANGARKQGKKVARRVKRKSKKRIQRPDRVVRAENAPRPKRVRKSARQNKNNTDPYISVR